MLALSYVIIITIIFFIYDKIEDYERLGLLELFIVCSRLH